MSGQISGMLEPASTGVPEPTGGFKSAMMGTLTPEKMANSTNEDLFLFPGELLINTYQCAPESDTPNCVPILVSLSLLRQEPLSRAVKVSKPQFPHLQTRQI